MTYEATRDRVETYFDKTATKAWEALTSDAPVSGIRATVRAGRDRMRDVLLSELPNDLFGRHILDAGCGTGAMAFELARRGAQVTAVDISPELIKIAEKRCPRELAHRITFAADDMTSPSLGAFHAAIAMDSLIYYDRVTLARTLASLSPRTGQILFTLPPKTPLLMAMWRAGKLFPRANRSPAMVPHSTVALAAELSAHRTPGRLREIERVTSGFYISTALEWRA